ncbi:tripartite tricarboxylate transporter substrate binding protein [Roseomonas eburnea]|uniref:Tripartite tricarboxylate transporter substrate binding protein n=1 Tax=Neoroseomonas eburnea TaxID=1346889 RepID=A0A9X9XB38_9PROT|nr:tripartite tricarboxylate transporter substrate binding protein [Neoroseomonas eburnea]MBR0680924.1 tripartite tricarboxylate transporter substrate binding protein [Neoroseomonas eburnea]
MDQPTSARHSQWRRRHLLGVAAALPTLPVLAQGTWPDRPIRLIVPYGAGTSTDIMTRLVSQHMAETLGQPMVVENRVGASGAVGSEVVAKSAPDGNTLLMGAVASHSVIVSLMPRLPYDPLRDFTHISLVTNAPNLLVVNPQVPARSLAEFIAWMKTQPGGVNYASAGNGTSSHLAGELLKMRTGAKLEHVPYRSGAQAVTDVVSGQVPMLVYQVTAVLPFVRDGKLRALATTSNQRLEWTPDVPTVEEQGVPDFDVAAWHGLFGPTGLPPRQVDTIYGAMRRALTDPGLRQRLLDQGLVPVGMPPTEFRSFLEADIVKWREVVRVANIRVD